MSARDLIDDRALEDEEDDESFDEETGDVREGPNGAKGRFEDSSEEDEDDDDEEAAAEVRTSCHNHPRRSGLTFTAA
jgi:transcription elongation factor SPT6